MTIKVLEAKCSQLTLLKLLQCVSYQRDNYFDRSEKRYAAALSEESRRMVKNR